MRSWYKPAQTKITHWREMCVQLDTDRTAMLPAAYTAIPVFDKEEQDKFKHRLELEYHWLLGLGEEPANREKISEFLQLLESKILSFGSRMQKYCNCRGL
ncbi:hypothetical protein PCI56_02500 [Plesiomonas shigelloides subsp. oncorhynchi]|nr:hypothetical protein [Plesiomonas shigelloides]